MKADLFISIGVVLLTFSRLPINAQTLELGDIKLTLGMSKQEVFNQAAFIMDIHMEGVDNHLKLKDIPDDEVLYFFRDNDVNCIKYNPGTCLAQIQFSNSRLSYASKSVYSGKTPERTISEVIGSFINAFNVPAGKIKPMNCTIFHYLMHDDSSLAAESVEITCGGHAVRISNTPIAGSAMGGIEESIGTIKAQKAAK